MGEQGAVIDRFLGDGEAEAAGVGAASALDPIAAALATSQASLDPKLAAYLAKQETLADIQIDDLQEQRDLQLAHLRVRRWKDRLSLTFQGLGVALAVAVLSVLGALAWQAHGDHGLVIEAFTAPPAFAARGVGGDTVAADVMGKLSSIASYVRENSFSSTGAVTTDRSNDVKIEIPQTGVSLSEAWRVLREWLGSARKVSGSLREEGDGRISLTARLDDGDAFTATGAAADLAALEQNVAEQVYGATDPNNLAIYLVEHGRKADAFAAAARYAAHPLDSEDRANAVSLLGDLSDDPEREARLGRIALRMDPGLMAGHFNVADADLSLERPQEALAHARAMLTVRSADQPRQHRGAGATRMLAFARSVIGELTGDFAAGASARADYYPQASERSHLLLANAVDFALRHEPSTSGNLIYEAQVFGSTEPWRERVARYWADAAREDWTGALAEATALSAMDHDAYATAKDPDAAAGLKDSLERRDMPMLAVAQARTGDPAGASASIASTPMDCYGCVRARGTVAFYAADGTAAERWFGLAIRQAPDLPMAYVDRGRARLGRGDIPGALSDAETAHRLGPHFADALKLWGDALARRGRWSQAVAKYDAALATAPAWRELKQARATAQAHRG